MLDAQPWLPVDRDSVADIGDSSIGPLALEMGRRRRYFPTRLTHLPAAMCSMPDDRRTEIGPDPRHGSQVATLVFKPLPLLHRVPKNMPHRAPDFGLREEIAHRSFWNRLGLPLGTIVEHAAWGNTSLPSISGDAYDPKKREKHYSFMLFGARPLHLSLFPDMRHILIALVEKFIKHIVIWRSRHFCPTFGVRRNPLGFVKSHQLNR